MQGKFNDDALEAALFEFIEQGVLESFEEYFDFGATCLRADGTYYGISKGKCRQGTETGAVEKPKRGRPKGGKNVAKAAPGDAAARMKAAYDKLVGINLSGKGTSATQKLQKSIETKMASGKTASSEITPSNLKAKMDAVNARADKAAREMAKYEDPSGRVRPENKPAWNKAYESYGGHMNDLKKLIDAKYQFQQRQKEVGQQMDRVGRQHMAEKDPAKKAQLEYEYKKYQSLYEKLEKAQTKEGTDTWMAKLGISERPVTTNWESAKAASAAKGKVTQAAELDRAIQKKLEEQGGAYVGSKLASMIEKRNRLKREIKEGTQAPKKDSKPETKTDPSLLKRQQEAVAAADKALASYNRAVNKEDAAYKKLMAAKDDGKSFEARADLRAAHKKAEAEAQAKYEVLRKADAEANALKNRGAELIDRPSDRLSLKQARQDARDWDAMRNRMLFNGEKLTEIQKADVGLSARLERIRGQKGAQDERIVASMNRSEAGKQLHNLNKTPERVAGVENIKMRKLMELKKKETDPKKIAKLDEQIKEANRVRLLMLKEIAENNARYAARKEASEQRAAALLEGNKKNAKRIGELAENISVMNHMVSAKGNEIDRIQKAQASLELHRQSIDKRLADNQERANKYGSMIRNAKSPSEKKLLEEAFKKRQPELNKAAMDAMRALDENERKLASLQKREIKERDQLDKAIAERHRYQRDLDKIKADGTVATANTREARRTANDVMRQLADAPKYGRFVETLGGTKPDFDMNVGPGSGAKRLSNGAYGTAFKKDGNPPATIKYGNIGRDEVNAMQRVAELGLAPKVLKGERVAGAGEEPGRFAYEYVKGKPMMDLAKQGRVGIGLKDDFWEARARMHKYGVAHNDLHPGNVIVDNGKIKFIDFGLARMGSKPALGEALGINREPGAKFNQWSNDGDRQAKRWGEAYGSSGGTIPPKLAKILSNREKVRDAMIKDGLPEETVNFLMKGGNYFRNTDDHFERSHWKRISDGAADRYMDILYDGVI